MLIEFFLNNLKDSLIKNIISNTPLPIHLTVKEGDWCIKGMNYIFRTFVISCTKTGYLHGDPLRVVNLEFGMSLDDDRATFVQAGVVGEDFRYMIGESTPGLANYRICNTGYYDTRTHELLGEYLRALRDVYDINLMHLYNCFSYNLINHFHLVESVTEDPKDDIINPHNISYTTDKSKKVIAIPIKFNRIYTIAIESSSTIDYKPIIYNNRGLVKKEDGSYLMDEFSELFTMLHINMTRFSEPFTFSINTNMKDADGNYLYDDLKQLELVKYSKYLYLILLIPASNKSSLVVLEGDYTKHRALKLVSLDACHLADLDWSMLTHILLLSMNNGKFYAYNDKLIEYLLNNVIHHGEVIPHNVLRVLLRVKTKDSDIDSKYILPTNDIWNHDLRHRLFSTYMTPKTEIKPKTHQITGRVLGYTYESEFNSHNKYDVNGFVDTDLEKYLYSSENDNGYIPPEIIYDTEDEE